MWIATASLEDQQPLRSGRALCGVGVAVSWVYVRSWMSRSGCLVLMGGRSRGGVGRCCGAGRESEVIDRLVDAVRGGESWVVVVRGKPGVGKSALLGYLEEGATGAGWRGRRG